MENFAGAVKKRNIPFYGDEKAFERFVARVTKGKFEGKVQFALKESESGFDEYRLWAKNGKIEIEATSGCAGGAALNAYLKKYCRYQFGILGVSGELPPSPPDTLADMTETSVFHYRYAFNYCTFGYTYAFNDWSDWERVTDYLILSGYNLVLNPIGNECVWVELLTKYGYTREEAKKYISAPNYLPWQWMMNLSAYRSEYPDYWFDEQKEISRKFNEKLKAFGMSAVLAGYCGAVPDDFGRKYPDVKIVPQGKWSNFIRPSFLLPENELFGKISNDYYRLQKEILGAEDAHYYSVDPFHEGGEKAGIDLKDFARRILAEMQRVDDKAVWALQGWLENPDREMLSAIPKSDVLIMNLQADKEPDGGDDFCGFAHVYCVVNNFGGEQAVRGSAKRTYLLAHEMAESDNSACCGIGMMPEGVECDEVLFDVIADVAVRTNVRPIREYLQEYIAARYGVCNEELIKAFEILFDKVYILDSSKYAHESGLIARPSPTVKKVCFWAADAVVEDIAPLTEVLQILLKYYEECESRAGYRVDLIAVARQLIGDISWRYIYPMHEAFAVKDKEAFERNKQSLQELFPLQRIVECDENLNYQRYLDKAAKRGKTDTDKRWLVRCAKQLITLWGERGADRLHDYAAREYGDMVKLYYTPRWEKYLQKLSKNMQEGKDFEDYDRYADDEAFLADGKEYTREVAQDLKPRAEAILRYALKELV